MPPALASLCRETPAVVDTEDGTFHAPGGDVIVPMMRYLVATHSTGRRVTSDGKPWGDAWQSAYPITLSGYLAVRLTLALVADGGGPTVLVGRGPAPFDAERRGVRDA